MAPSSSSLSSSGGDMISLIQEIALVVMRKRPKDINGFLAEYLERRDRGDVRPEIIPQDPDAITALNRLYSCLDRKPTGNGGVSGRPDSVEGAKSVQETQNARTNLAKKGRVVPSRIPVWTPGATASRKLDKEAGVPAAKIGPPKAVEAHGGEGQGSLETTMMDKVQVLNPPAMFPKNLTSALEDSAGTMKMVVPLVMDGDPIDMDGPGTKADGRWHPQPPTSSQSLHQRKKDKVRTESRFKGNFQNPKFVESQLDLVRRILSGDVGIFEAPFHATIIGWILLAGFIFLVYAFQKLHAQLYCWKFRGNSYA